MSTPNVVIEVRGGAVTGIVADGKVRCVVVDHDTDGMDDTTMKQFPVGTRRTEGVDGTDWGIVEKSKGFVKAALKALGF
jgi:hypothetical protein